MKKWERGVVFGVLLPPTAGREKSLKTRSHFSLCMGELRWVNHMTYTQFELYSVDLMLVQYTASSKYLRGVYAVLSTVYRLDAS